MVIEKLEKQLKELKQQFLDQENRLEERLAVFQKLQNDLEAALDQSQALNADYREQIASIKTKKELAPKEASPFKSLNIFDL